MNKILFIGLFVFMQLGLVAQSYDTITLIDCYREAENNFPLLSCESQKELKYKEIGEPYMWVSNQTQLTKVAY